ncbi:MAG: hypothetical protein KJ721_02055 [Nanoarchaeota archaeon]|nr:hypothetical protein [Nanoarchaeota archaeon]
MKRGKNPRAQMQLSFGMIFSIILIIVFIAFAFFAVKKLLGMQDSIKVGQFADKLQSDIDKIWKGSQGSQMETYTLPSKIEFICFVDYSSSRRGPKQSYYGELKQVYYEGEDMILYPIGSGAGSDSFKILHLNIEKITDNENPYCIENKKGKVELIIEKDFGENLVGITR